MVMQWVNSAVSRYINPQPLYGLRPAQALPPIGRLHTIRAAEMYRILRAYYFSNGMFDIIQDILRRQSIWKEALKPLRNPAYRTVEFHAGHMWPGALPGALPIMAAHDEIIKPIQQVWQWSNWAANKQVGARHSALYGDMFLKVAQTKDKRRVFIQTIEPEHVTDFDTDERDFITYVRFDVPMLRRNQDGTTTPYLHTEEWSKATGMFRLWESESAFTSFQITDVSELGDPIRTEEIEAFGINFVPVVHAKFMDIGEDRGMGAFVPALDKIDEACRQATRLNQMLFRNMGGVWALEANSEDAAGRPMPPPRINDTDGTTDDDGTITLGDDKLLKLPGRSKLASLVPNIDYGAALNILKDHMLELEQDLPELVMYRISESGNLSGRAVRLMLAPAIARLTEARGSAESALIRADQMALTMGANAGLWDVGTFENGDFEHAFEERDVLPNDELERAQAQQADGAALASYVSAGLPLEVAVQELWGWTPERAAQFTIDRLAAIQREQAMAQEDVTDPTTDDLATAAAESMTP
jgi:hypothetical protein